MTTRQPPGPPEYTLHLGQTLIIHVDNTDVIVAHNTDLLIVDTVVPDCNHSEAANIYTLEWPFDLTAERKAEIKANDALRTALLAADYDAGTFRGLFDAVEDAGGNYCEITQTHPHSMDAPSRSELETAIDWLLQHARKDAADLLAWIQENTDKEDRPF